MNDAWKTSVETQLGQLHGDIRMLLGMGIGAVGLVLAAFALAYVSLSGSVASVQSEQAKATTRLDGIDKRLNRWIRSWIAFSIRWIARRSSSYFSNKPTFHNTLGCIALAISRAAMAHWRQTRAKSCWVPR
jgi:hypothetical protein